jgi:hypothetical protein
MEDSPYFLGVTGFEDPHVPEMQEVTVRIDALSGDLKEGEGILREMGLMIRVSVEGRRPGSGNSYIEETERLKDSPAFLDAVEEAVGIEVLEEMVRDDTIHGIG